MIVLGIWGFSSDSAGPTHESGACIIANGQVAGAITEERLSRIKNDGGYPFRAIAEVLRITGVPLSDIDHIALAGLPPLRRASRMLHAQWELYRDNGTVLPRRLLYALLTAKKLRRTVPGELSRIPRSEWPHHLCHAAAGFYASPFDRATVITLDGIGDSSICGSINAGEGTSLRVLHEFNGYYSPGILYSFVTKTFGFRPARHEGKLTGLAAYGNPDVCIDTFRKLLRYDTATHRFVSTEVPRLFGPMSEDMWSIPLVSDLLDRHDRKDIAAALQRHLEEEVVRMVRDAISITGIPDVALAGGVFSNVKLNQRIREMPEVRSIYIHPGMGDDGLMVGAAYLASCELARRRGKPLERAPLENVYLGPWFSSAEVSSVLDRKSVTYRRVDDIDVEVARLLAEGRVVGRMAGRMEYGPRALGNRSILAGAKDKTINAWLNEKLRRTEFMPFAPSLLEEDAALYFRNWRPQDSAGRFMTMTYDVFPERQADCPAVVHVDGTARPQVVREPDNPRFHRLLRAYKELTGTSVLVNTSFNIHEEPIVCSPEDALRAFESGGVDVLALEDCLVTR